MLVGTGTWPSVVSPFTDHLVAPGLLTRVLRVVVNNQGACHVTTRTAGAATTSRAATRYWRPHPSPSPPRRGPPTPPDDAAPPGSTPPTRQRPPPDLQGSTPQRRRWPPPESEPPSVKHLPGPLSPRSRGRVPTRSSSYRGHAVHNELRGPRP